MVDEAAANIPSQQNSFSLGAASLWGSQGPLAGGGLLAHIASQEPGVLGQGWCWHANTTPAAVTVAIQNPLALLMGLQEVVMPKRSILGITWSWEKFQIQCINTPVHRTRP
ncbi:unnamed protein product [Boreogadus saida]